MSSKVNTVRYINIEPSNNSVPKKVTPEIVSSNGDMVIDMFEVGESFVSLLLFSIIFNSLADKVIIR